MRTYFRAKSFFLLTFLLAGWFTLQAQEIRPVQIAFWNPLQVIPSDYAIHGVRINILYGVNQELHGADFGIWNETLGDQIGGQFGAVNINGGSFTGARAGLFNWSKGELKGVSYGAVNMIDGPTTGLVAGTVNVNTGNLKGVQFGGVSVLTGTDFNGFIAGLVNVFRTKPGAGVENRRKGVMFGVVNYADSMKGAQIGLININKTARIKFFPIVNINK